MELLLTLDVGTTAVKAGLFTKELQSIDFVTKEYTLLTPDSGIVELDPNIYWLSVVDCVQQIMRNTDTDPKDIICMTCTTQGETIIPVDARGEALHNAIVWLDTRAQKEAECIKKGFSTQAFYRYTGCPEISPIWPVAKILWLKNNKPDIYRRASKMLLLEDYLIAELTGIFVTNPAVSCSTGYFDISTGRVWEPILDYCGIDADKIPEVLPCGTRVGNLTESAAQQLGLSAETSVSTGAMDQVASAIGSANIADGIVTETTGTAQVVAATWDLPDLETWTPVTVYAHAVPKKYLLVNISQTAGIIYKWFRDEFCQDIVDRHGADAFNVMGEMASKAPVLSNGLTLFPHFTGMQVPRLDANTRGVFFGVGLHTGRDCFIRAIMEGVGYMLRENIEALEKMGISPSVVYALGGGAKSMIWNRIKADICGQAIAVMENEESASLGAAILGGVSCGLFNSIESAIAGLKEKKRIAPDRKNMKEYEKGYAHYKKMYENFKDLF